MQNLMVKIFGNSWRTSFIALLGIICQLTNPILAYLGTLKVPQHYMDGLTLVFALLFAIYTKDKNVTGVS